MKVTGDDFAGEDFVFYLRMMADAFIWNRKRNRKPQPGATYFLNLLEAQVEEAREHEANGLWHKTANELADCIAVAYEALRTLGYAPEHVTVERICTRILPHIEEIDAAYGNDGRKEAAPE